MSGTAATVMPALSGRNILWRTYATANVEAPLVVDEDWMLKYSNTLPTSTPLSTLQRKRGEGIKRCIAKEIAHLSTTR